MKILDKGEVTLLNHMGGDLAVIAAARVSNGASYEEASKGPEADQKLINYLVKHRHGTPFEHSTFQFYIKAPLFVRSEWHRHRIASYNEISGRYVEYEPEFYIPSKMRIPAQSNKQGSAEPTGKWAQDWYEYGPAYNEQDALTNWNDVSRASIEAATNASWIWYQDLIHHKGVAKEMARMILPLNLYTQFYMTINARSLSNFCSLRSADDAQWEIRQYSLEIEKMWGSIMPMTYKAWVDNGRVQL
jgi:thymidylate synthase (FAD)